MEALEQDRTALEERINRLELERTSKEQETLSTDVIAETYCDFPFIVSRLRQEGNLHGLKDLLACYIAAIDIHQEEEDPSSGHMNIMLFEEELPGWKPHLTQLNGAQEKTLTFQPLTGWNCERVERLPETVAARTGGFVELGSFAVRRLRRLPIIEFYPWNKPPATVKTPKSRPDGLQLARYYQSLMESGTFENRAALARFLGVSRARVTQVLNRLKESREAG